MHNTSALTLEGLFSEEITSLKKSLIAESIKEVQLPTALCPGPWRKPQPKHEKGSIKRPGRLLFRRHEAGEDAQRINEMSRSTTVRKHWRISAPLPSALCKLQKWHFLCRRKQKTMDSHHSTDVRLFISHHKSKTSPSTSSRSYLMSWHSSSQNVLHCVMSDCSANYSSICGHSCPFNPELPQRHHESPISKACRARIERLLSVSFESQSGIKAPSQHYIIEMILKATCPLRLGFLNAFPHYLLRDGTRCCSPRRIDALLAAWAKQCWAADGFLSSQSDSECFLPAAV